MRNKKFIVGFILFLLLVAVPLTIYQVFRTQLQRSGAAGEAISLRLNPQTKTVAVGEWVSIEVLMNGGQNDVSAVDLKITYDDDLFDYQPNNPLAGAAASGFSPSENFDAVINENVAPGTIRFAGVNTGNTQVTGPSINVGTLNLRAKAAGTVNVGFADVQITASGVSDLLPFDTQNTQTGTYTISTTTTLTPTPTMHGDPVGQATLSLRTSDQTVNTGQSFTVTLSVNSGLTSVNVIDTTITYPSNLLQRGAITYTNAFPTEAFQTFGNGTIRMVRGTTQPITGDRDIATITFQATAGGTANITLSNSSVIASQNNSNIFTMSTDTQVTISGPTITPQNTPTPTIQSTPTPTTVPTGTTSQTNLDVTIGITGIGNNQALGLNNNPRRNQRYAEAAIINAQNQQVLTTVGVVNYDSASGFFKGKIPIINVPSGTYSIKLKLDNTLWRRVGGIFTITQNQDTLLPSISLVPGDVNDDNEINLLDYTELLSCIRNRTGCANVTINGQADLENIVAYFKSRN